MSAPIRIRTPIWGNTNGVGAIADFSDIAAVVNAFRGVYSPTETYQSVNIMGVGATACTDVTLNCTGQGCINFGDVAGAVDAFRGVAFPCPAVCP